MLFYLITLKTTTMKKLFTILMTFFVLASAPAVAQFNFGVKAGMNFAEKPSKLSDFDAKGKSGWFFGPTAKLMLPIVGLGVEANLLYSQNKTEIAGESMTKKSIDLPVYLRYEISLPVLNKILEPFVAVGPQWSWNLGDKDLDWNLGNIKSEYKIKNSNMSLNLGLGAIIIDHIQFHVNYNLALGKTSEFTTLSNGVNEVIKSKTNTWQVSVAYIF
jgi:hypothetical protein